MKKIIYSVLIVQILFFTACSKDIAEDRVTIDFEDFLIKWDLLDIHKNACTSITDAIKLPEKWSKEDCDNFANLPAETFYSMSTCGLLETLLDYPFNRLQGPWCSTCSDSNLPGVTMFNDKLRRDKVVTELFGRDDCFSVLASEYLRIIEDERESGAQIKYFETLLSSDMCMLALNKNEKVKLMAMALKRGMGETEFLMNSSYIMIAIMKAFNYPPFMKKVNANLKEYTFGYSNLNDYDILKYAKIFLNEQNLK